MRWERPVTPETPTIVVVAGLVAAVLIVTLVVWFQPEPMAEGTVVARSYDDPDDWTTGGYSTLSCSPNPQGQVTCTSTWVPEEDHHDGPHWHLQIEGTRTDGDEGTGWVEVSELDFDRCMPGDRWVRGEPCLGGRR